MLCKFCNKEVEEGLEVCPFCGKNLQEEPVVEEAPAAMPEMEETAAEAEAVVAAESEAETEVAAEVVADAPVPEEKKDNPQKKSVLPIVLSAIAAVAALSALAIVLLMALGVNLNIREMDWFKRDEAIVEEERPNDIFAKDAYTVDDETAKAQSETVVATMGDKVLTNVVLQLYYRMQVVDFLQYYGSYAAQVGFDYTQPLSEQPCYFDSEQSWEQYMVEVAIDTWKNYQSLALLAEEEGFVMDEEWQATLDQIPNDLKTQAEQDGYESVDALLADVIGAGCTQAHYMEYVTLACMSNAYYAYLEESLIPTDEEVDAYFTANEAVLAESGITKDMGMIADVRHILIMPKGGTTSEETGETVYSEEEKKAAYDEAERILNEWKKGEATEDSFAALANTYSEDGGSNTTGGLYEDIAPGASYVENFLNWTIDMNRQIGETGIVETEYGYHIMFYVGGEPYWRDVVSTQLLSESVTAITDGAKEKWVANITYKNISLAELNLV